MNQPNKRGPGRPRKFLTEEDRQQTSREQQRKRREPERLRKAAAKAERNAAKAAEFSAQAAAAAQLATDRLLLNDGANERESLLKHEAKQAKGLRKVITQAGVKTRNLVARTLGGVLVAPKR